MYAGGCLNLSDDYPHVLIVLGFGITGALTNVIIKLSIYAESQQDVWRQKGKIGHPVDVVGLFGSADCRAPRHQCGSAGWRPSRRLPSWPAAPPVG